jgi:hypothetical protein
LWANSWKLIQENEEENVGIAHANSHTQGVSLEHLPKDLNKFWSVDAGALLLNIINVELFSISMWR